MNSLKPELQFTGLTETQAKSLLERYGENSIEVASNSPLKILLRQFLSPLIWLLIVAAVISFSTSQLSDGVVIVTIVLINAWLGFRQEYQANRVYEKLVGLITSNAAVIRNSKHTLIDRKLLVPGDIVLLKLGDVVPADCFLVAQENLIVDESTLSGESMGVTKHLNPYGKVAMNTGILYSGSYITKGTAVGKIFATGTNSEFGKIASLSTNTHRQSEYEVNLKQLSRGFTVVAAVFLVGLFAAHILLNKQEGLSELLLFTLAIAITIIPEALPVVAAITLATQARKLGDIGVLVKRGAAIEDLGNVDVICTDKTGTLTENHMRIVEAVSDDPHKLAKYAYQASFGGNDPFDDAIVEFTNKHHPEHTQAPAACEDIPFNPDLKFSGRKFEDMTIYKGAPEYILSHSMGTVETHGELLKINEFAEKGYRAISVAVSRPNTKKYMYLGTYLLVDPVKPDAAVTVARAYRQGISIKIITGDSAKVSYYVAEKVGLVTDMKEITDASDLAFNDPVKLTEQVERFKVFTRANPEQKYAIIQALQKSHQVGYLGDGINDAPSLKLANASMVVNTASDVAKATADIIILTHSLSVIIDGILDGRRAFENIDKYLKQTLVSNFGNFFTIGLLSLFTDFLPMLPLQILLNNLIVDIPEITLSRDNVDTDELRRPKQHDIFHLLRLSVILGAVSSVFDFIFFAWAMGMNFPPFLIQGLWFSYSTLEEILLIFVIRTRKLFFKGSKPVNALVLTAVIAFALTAIISLTGIPALTIVRLSVVQLFVILLIAVGCVLASEVVKNRIMQAARLRSRHKLG